MTDFWSAVMVLALLMTSAGAGLFVQRFLTDAHRSRESRELSQAVTSMLVTFAALVLGLLISTVEQTFDQAGTGVRSYAVALIELSHTLQDLGPEADPVRAMMRGYVEQVIATTWTDKSALAASHTPSPTSLESAALGAILERVEHEIRRLPANDSAGTQLVADAVNRFERVRQIRWNLIEGSRSSIPTPFYWILVFWLMIVFASLGLIAPRNLLAAVMLGLGAVAIASVVFAALELDGPFGGLLAVSSDPMRDALAHLSQ